MKEIKKHLNIKNIVIIIGITIITIIICYISIHLQNQEVNTLKINGSELESEYGKIAVYMSGAINNPGMYFLKENTRLEDALNIVGGIKQDADLSKVNLSKILYDSEKVVIPYIQEESVEIDDTEQDKNTNSDIVNINDAGEIELMTLSGIGEATAKKIIEYRKNGKFESIEDIKKVPGIGDSKFNKIKDKISVE